MRLLCVGCLQDDIKELKRKLKLQVHQVDQMKEEIAFQDAVVSQANLEKANAEKELENLKVKL